MGMKTWKIGAKAAGTHVRGQVIVANRAGELDAYGRALGKEIGDELNRVAKQWRPGNEKQPESGEVAKDLASLTVMAGIPLLLLRRASTPESAGSAARLMVDVLREAIELEPRFAGSYGLAVMAREQAGDGRMDQMRLLCDSMSWALPQPVERAGLVDRAMRVEVRDVAFPKPGAELQSAGLAEFNLNLKCDEVDGHDVGRQPSSMYFPLPLFGPSQAEPLAVLEMMVGDLQVLVDLETKRCAYGVLRDMLFAVEDVVEEHRLEQWGSRPA